MSYADRYIEFLDADGIFQNDPTDVYSVIKSPEIRDFFKNHIRLNVLEREQLLLKSYISMRQKIDMLKKLAPYGTEQEADLLNGHCAVLEQCMADIYQPNKRSIFVFECAEPYFEDCRIMEMKHINGFFDTMDELIHEIESCFRNSETQLYGYITVLQLPRSGKTRTPFDFTVFWINGSWQVKDIIVDAGHMVKLGFAEKAVRGLDGYSMSELVHFPLPFENGNRLRLQTPFMEGPFYGILDSGCAFPGEWHHYLWNEKNAVSLKNKKNLYTRKNMKNCVSLSSIELSIYSGYSTLDWLERA